MIEIKQRMIDSLPLYYSDSPEVDAIMDGNAIEIERKRREARDLLDQFFVRTATWGLNDWERVLALPPMPSATVEFRRQRILVKLRGTAPATVKYLTDLVNVYTTDNGARIVEYNNEYRFEAEIHADNKIRSGDIYKAIDEVKPAHLAFGLAVIAPSNIGVHYRDYKFPVPYRICNMFRTADIPGALAKSPVNLREKAYSFDVIYPICNTFYPTFYQHEVKESIQLDAQVTQSNVLYNRVSNSLTAGEVSL